MKEKNMDIQLPVVLITGAGRGLGRGIALQMAKEGCSVVINFVHNAKAAADAAAACSELRKDPCQQFFAVQADISLGKERERLVAAVLEKAGRIDALVNNAGIAPKVRTDITSATEDSFDIVINTNLKGPYFLTQAVADYWLTKHPEPKLRNGFKVIFITSLSTYTASINRGEYCIAKAGLSMARQLWAARLAPENIQVVELRPGIMSTDMTAGAKAKYDKLISEGLVPQERWGTAEDMGLAAAAILKGEFPFSAGAVIDIDGGFQLRRL